MNRIFVKIEGIHCSHCENKIKQTLLKNKQIKNITIKNNIATIDFKGVIKNQEIISLINNLGYRTKNEYISTDIKELDNNIRIKEFFLILSVILILIFLLKKLFGFNIFSKIPTIDSSVTYGMLLIIGLLTSIHCISMCGAINLMVNYNSSNKSKYKRPLMYNIGRIISYTMIGGIAGLIGNIISINNIVNGLIILIAALITFLVSLKMLGIINFNILNRWNIKVKNRTKNSLLIGLLNGFMPCGPLQAMQIYALQTGSALKGALSMFLFSIGTVPLMLFVGIIVNSFQGRKKILLNKISAILILILSIMMINRGVQTLGIDITKFLNIYKNYNASTIKKDYQEIKVTLSYNNYEDIIIQKNIPVKLIIHVEKKYLTGCNEEIYIKEYNIKQKLKIGANIVEFTPTQEGEFTMSCWMNMIKNTIKVIDNKTYFKESK